MNISPQVGHRHYHFERLEIRIQLNGTINGAPPTPAVNANLPATVAKQTLAPRSSLAPPLNDAALTEVPELFGLPQAIQPINGMVWSDDIASFVTPLGAAGVSDFAVSIHWGDGTADGYTDSTNPSNPIQMTKTSGTQPYGGYLDSYTIHASHLFAISNATTSATITLTYLPLGTSLQQTVSVAVSPGAPTNLTSTTTATSASLNWTGTAPIYEVTRSALIPFINVGTSTTGSFRDSTARPGNTYDYRVYADYGNGVKPWTDATVTMPELQFSLDPQTPLIIQRNRANPSEGGYVTIRATGRSHLGQERFQ